MASAFATKQVYAPFMEKLPKAELLSKYAGDNKESLSIVGVVATITALFLNLNQDFYSQSLKDLQLLLLLFLALTLIFLSLKTLFWFKEKADSFLGGFISYTLFFFVWKLVLFINENFRQELVGYLNSNYIIATIILISYLLSVESNLRDRIPQNIFKPAIEALIGFIYMYVSNILISLYSIFLTTQKYSFSILLETLKTPYLYLVSIWILVLRFSALNIPNQKLWFKIVLFLPIPALILTLVLSILFKYPL
jgi:hypothetical protein